MHLVDIGGGAGLVNHVGKLAVFTCLGTRPTEMLSMFAKGLDKHAAGGATSILPGAGLSTHVRTSRLPFVRKLLVT